MDRHATNACAALEREAISRGVGETVATRAARATRSALGRDPSMTRRRIEAYFWAVVRRSSVRASDSRHVAQRLVLDAVIEDLRRCGRGDDSIARELERGWRGRVADDVLQDARARLVA